MKKRSVNKAGFTSIELVVVIAIIMFLATLILPILKNIREGGRRAECMENLKQLGIAFSLYQADYNGFFPASVWWDNTSAVGPYGGYSVGGVWDYSLGPYVLDGEQGSAAALYFCPTYESLHPDYNDEPNPIARTYAMSEGWAPGISVKENPEVWPHLDRIKRPMNTILLGPVKRISGTTWGGNPIESATILSNLSNVDFDRHNGGAYYLFVDGHIAWLSENTASDTAPNLWDN